VIHPSRIVTSVDRLADLVDEHVRAAPALPLRPYVAWYTGYRQRGVAPTVHRGLPSPGLTLIFTLDEPLFMAAHPDPRQAPGTFTTLIGGLHTGPALITHQGAQSGIQVALGPLGSRLLFGLPAGELAEIDVPADDVLGPLARRIHARLGSAPAWPERFAVLDEEFGRLVRSCREASVVLATPAEVVFAWRLLLRSGGRVPIAELAARTGWSTRHLENRFRTEIGLTPKAAARVIRFTRARERLARPDPAQPGSLARPGSSARPGSPARPGSLADLAVACGYFDQAHLAREFRALAGCPPSQWLTEEFANIQAGAWRAAELSLT
jgi:AraC-like DNA-binding protein